jgi:hypothetical protein
VIHHHSSEVDQLVTEVTILRPVCCLYRLDVPSHFRVRECENLQVSKSIFPVTQRLHVWVRCVLSRLQVSLVMMPVCAMCAIRIRWGCGECGVCTSRPTITLESNPPTSSVNGSYIKGEQPLEYAYLHDIIQGVCLFEITGCLAELVNLRRENLNLYRSFCTRKISGWVFCILTIFFVNKIK